MITVSVVDGIRTKRDLSSRRLFGWDKDGVDGGDFDMRFHSKRWRFCAAGALAAESLLALQRLPTPGASVILSPITYG